MTGTDDKSLIIRLQYGDKAAFDALYWRYHAGIYANVIKLTRDEVSSEDIVQETFIKLWEKRNSLESNKGIAGWLFVTSYHLVISHLRKITKENERDRLLSEMSFTAEESPSVTEAQWQLLEEAVQKLSPQKKRVFELCKMEGKTYEQAALEMDISRHTVKEYLSDGITAIKQYIHQNQKEYILIIGLGLLANIIV